VKQHLADPSHILYGFRYATADEVKSLYNAAGLHVVDESPYFEKEPYATPDATRQLLDLLSITYESASSSRFYGITGTHCPEFPYGRCSYGRDDELVVSSIAVDELNRTYAAILIEKLPETHYKSNLGHFLVRLHEQ